MRKWNSSLFILWTVIMMMTSCQLGPKYRTPSPIVPCEWKSETKELPVPEVDYWWEIFGDETLNNLECSAIKYNPDLYVALERVVEARALAGVSRANLFPQVNLTPIYNDSMYLTQFQGPNNGTGTEALSLVPFRIHQFDYEMPLNLSYELDLWGTYRGQYRSAVYSAQAQADAYYAALLTLTADLAAAYFQLRGLDAQLDLLETTMKVRKDAYEVNQSRWDAGLVNYTDVTRAALEYSNAEAQMYDAQRLRAIQENAIAVLTGMRPSQMTIAHDALNALPPEIPAGLPANVLLKRPDIAQAEREIASQHALIGVAYAAFFPQISLTGTVGFLSPDIRYFLDWKSRLWSMGANAVQMIFDGGRDFSNLNAAWAAFCEASGTYQSLVLTALQEVEDSLLSLEWQALQYGSLQKSVQFAKLTTELSTERYLRGLVNYLDVVDSERAELEVELSAINVLTLRYISTVQLVKAIGGGW